MKNSVSVDLINLGITFCFTLILLAVVCGIVSCIINLHNNDDNHHDYDNSDNHIIINITESTSINPSILRSIPIIDFSSKDFKENIECVICLSDLVDGDKSRILPSCNHWFHADCIDSWFGSRSTCPICRQSVGLVQLGTRPELGGDDSLTRDPDTSFEHPVFQTNAPPCTDMAVVEHAVCGEANEVRSDFSAVV